MKAIVVFCTIPPGDAEEMARALVENRLAACVNVIPEVRSFYWWEGRLCDDPESLLVVKTTEARFQDLVSFVKANHPYTVPEIIALPVSEGNPDYLRWVEESTR